jgi:hypothetical protein
MKSRYSTWKPIQGNSLEAKIAGPQRFERNENELGKNSNRRHDKSSSWLLSHLMKMTETLPLGKDKSLSSKISDVDYLSVLGGVFALLFLVLRAKEKIHKQKRFRHLQEFLNDSSDHDLMLDINYRKSKDIINYGSFVPIQMGDIEKYDI